MDSFVLWGHSLKVLHGFMLAMFVAAVAPATYFTAKYWQLGRLFKQEKKRQSLTSKDADSFAKTAALLDHGRYELFLERAQQLVDSPEKLVLVGKALLYSHKPGEAIAPLKQAFQEFGKTEAGYLLCKAMRSNGQSPVGTLEALIEKEPEHSERAYKLLLDALDRDGLWDSCLQLVGKMEKKGLPVEAWRKEGYQYEAIGANDVAGKKKMDAYQQLIKNNPGFSPAYLAIGTVYLENQAIDKALAIWEQGYLQTGSSIFLDQLERFYLQQDRPEDAIQVYRELLARDNAALTQYRLGKLFSRLEMLDESIEIYEALRPDFDQVGGFLVELSSLYAKRGHMEQALETLAACDSLSKELSINYRCKNCGQEFENWLARCSQCGHWNGVQALGSEMVVEKIPTAPLYY